MFEDIDYAVEGAAAVITFNRPEKMNAIRRQTIDDLLAAMDEAEADDRVRAIVFTGKGRAFCAGMDLDIGFVPSPDADPETGEGVPPDFGGTIALRLFESRKPLIGAVNGAAVGFGATVLLPMDFRIAAEGARFGYVFSRRGVVSETCASWFLPRVVGVQTAMDWMLTGRIFDAVEAKAAGLVGDVVAPEKLLPAAFAIAEEIAGNTSAASVAINRQLVWRMLGADHPRVAHDYESRGLAATFRLPDSAEATRAFLEKRTPQFASTAKDADVMDAWWPKG